MELLKKELPVYLSKCADTDQKFCPFEWWKQNALAVPNWAIAASKVLLVQLSSAASEHVFLYSRHLLMSNRPQHYKTT